MPVLDPHALVEERVHALRRFHRLTGLTRAQLDLSGGIDSAVMLGLLARALGPEAITAVHSGIHSDPGARARAEEVAATFRVPLVVIDLTDLYEALVSRMQDRLTDAGHTGVSDRIAADPTILGSIRSTLRAPVGRGFNRLTGGGVRHGTGNECEDRWLRFYQKGGDGEVDTNPIAMLSKAEVGQLALALGVPASVRRAVPSPDLWGVGAAHDDESEIGSFLGVDPGEHAFYGTVDPNTGACLRAGLIERVSRWLDQPWGDGRSNEQAWFVDEAPADEALDRRGDALADLDEELAARLLLAARRAERITRHKLNPACPTLGRRADLLAAGILTDTLPEATPCAR